jgi:hypothetical protein
MALMTSILDQADDSHHSIALWANQQIDFVDLLNQPGQAFPARRRGLAGYDNTGDTSKVEIPHFYL